MANGSYRILCARWELKSASPPLGGFFVARINVMGRSMAAYLWIAIGSALGGVTRFWCSGLVARYVGETFPLGTILVNVLGCFIIGFFATLTGPDGRVFADTLSACLAATPPSHRSACRP